MKGSYLAASDATLGDCVTCYAIARQHFLGIDVLRPSRESSACHQSINDVSRIIHLRRMITAQIVRLSTYVGTIKRLSSLVRERKAETVAEGIYPRIFSHVFNSVTFFIYETKIIKLRFTMGEL